MGNQMTMRHIYKRFDCQKDLDANLYIVDDLCKLILGQEMISDRLASREETPCHSRYLRPSCRKVSTQFPGL